MMETSYLSPVGPLTLVSDGECIIEIRWERCACKKTDYILEKTKEQLSEYFKGAREYFDIPIKPRGSKFQKKVWNRLLEIPYGSTCSYGELARVLGNNNLSRAVGGANSKNPIPILIPCHRVIGRNGELVGFAGGIEVKSKLLFLER